MTKKLNLKVALLRQFRLTAKMKRGFRWAQNKPGNHMTTRFDRFLISSWKNQTMKETNTSDSHPSMIFCFGVWVWEQWSQWRCPDLLFLLTSTPPKAIPRHSMSRHRLQHVPSTLTTIFDKFKPLKVSTQCVSALPSPLLNNFLKWFENEK